MNEPDEPRDDHPLHSEAMSTESPRARARREQRDRDLRFAGVGVGGAMDAESPRARARQAMEEASESDHQGVDGRD
ncbi:hypothetical protein GMJLKIPL_5991 [Methylobacterium isbiliense]|uniref:Uncharacterized protein n=1 Tax=Methylobacterium isbiliense TaxID=315478 RepID=A0ABQ4SLD9_9HYPH|nr:hypothetical protein GMJLKIPL_5991 [Methylobacterium isbiliense]